MSGIMSRWVVSQEHQVSPGDLESHGTVSDKAIEHWVESVRLAYLELCTLLRQTAEESNLELVSRVTTLPRGSALGNPTDVLVTATAAEFRPDEFAISVRVRPSGGHRELPVNARCVIRIEDPTTGEAHELGNDIRDELIALEHSARHFN